MKKNIGNSLYNRNGKNAAFGTRTSLEWFLDVGHHLGTMIERGFLVTDYGEELTPVELRRYWLFKSYWFQNHPESHTIANSDKTADLFFKIG